MHDPNLGVGAGNGKVMGEAVLDPPLDELAPDLAQCAPGGHRSEGKSRMGGCLETIKRCEERYGDDYIVVIACDKGWFFVYTKGAGIYSR